MANLPNTNYGTPVQPAQPTGDMRVQTVPNTPTGALPNSYDELQKAQPSTLDFMKQTDIELGIPQQQKMADTLREGIYSLEDQLKRVAPNVDATTKQSLVTQAQRENMINAGKAPIQENLNTAITGYGRIQEGITALQDRAARLTSGFTADKQTNLELALAKIQRGEQLSDIEAANAFELLQQENEYKRQVEMAKTEYNRQRSLIKLGTDENIRQSNATYRGGGGGGGYGDPNPYYNPPSPTKTAVATYEYPPGSGVFRTQEEINAIVASQKTTTTTQKKGLTTSLRSALGF